MLYVYYVTMLIDYTVPSCVYIFPWLYVTVPSCDYFFPWLHVYSVIIAPRGRY